VAIRSHPVKPAMVVYHRPSKVDELAVKLSELEGVPLVVTFMELEHMMRTLQGIGR